MTLHKKGFTLIELLVVVAIIGILATIVLASLGAARIRAKDAAIVSRLSSVRTDIELNYASGNYGGLCTSVLYSDLETYVDSQGGNVTGCYADAQGYRIAAYDASGNQSISMNSFLNTAHAQMIIEDESPQQIGGLLSKNTGFCINSNGFIGKIPVEELDQLSGEPFCTLLEKEEVTGIVACGENGQPQCAIRRTCTSIYVNGSIVSVPSSCYNFETFQVEPSSACSSRPPYSGGCR